MSFRDIPVPGIEIDGCGVQALGEFQSVCQSHSFDAFGEVCLGHRQIVFVT